MGSSHWPPEQQARLDALQRGIQRTFQPTIPITIPVETPTPFPPVPDVWLPPPSPTTQVSIQALASAVVDEIERRTNHPLRVTPADIRHWCPELRGPKP